MLSRPDFGSVKLLDLEATTITSDIHTYFKVQRRLVVGLLLKCLTLQVLPSPTTGKFSFAPSGDYRDSILIASDSDKGKENSFEDMNASSFAFKPIAESASFPYFAAANKVIDYALFRFARMCITCLSALVLLLV